MKASTKRQIETALRASLEKILGPGQQQDTQRLREFCVRLFRLVEKYGIRPEEMSAAGVVMGAAPMLSKEEEPTGEELKKIMQAIRDLPFKMRGAWKAQLKEFPRKRGGGRKKLLTAAQEVQVCDELGRLVSRGVPLKEGYGRVARHFRVSERTIKRTWEKRRQIFTPERENRLEQSL